MGNDELVARGREIRNDWEAHDDKDDDDDDEESDKDKRELR